jgi:uncharacterized protein
VHHPPKSPLVLDLRDFARRAGNQRELTLIVPAPTELGIEVLTVPEGAPLDLELRLESVMEGVLVTGTARAGLEGECARCLTPIEDEVDVDLQELYFYELPEDLAADETEETPVVVDDTVDLEPLLRDAVVLALPFQPLCRDDCLGLCAECGANLNDDPDHAHEAPIDPRWAGLAGLANNED